MKRSSNGVEGGGGGNGGASGGSNSSGGSPGGSTQSGSSDWWKRDFCYATLTLVTFPLPFVLRSVTKKGVAYGQLVEHIIEHNEIPLPNICFLFGVELVKVVLTGVMFPAGSFGSGGGSSTEGRVSSKLPVSRRDRDASSTRSGGFYSKAVELWKSLWNFGASCAICHIAMVLFGAPVIENFSLTLEFSVILVSLSVFPLYLSMKASSILTEIAYISVWNTHLNVVFLAKWRLLLTLFGCMLGAIFIPLDWDRPWQKWPITCLISSMITFYSIHVIFFVYIFCTVYCKSLKSIIFNRNSNKIKYF